MKHIVVIGGGLAGLAAAVDLSERGIRVTVVESRNKLGGRAYSFEDEETGTIVDNGQHAMMGCYASTLGFFDKIGAGGKLFRQTDLRVEIWHPDRGIGTIAFSRLPRPLHAMSGILGFRLLSRREQMLALLAGVRMLAMRRFAGAELVSLTVAELMERLAQSQNARDCFWYPVAIATLNELPERASAAPFVEVVARAFFGTREDAQFVLARVGLSELYAEDAERYIVTRGGAVEVRSLVDAIHVEAGVARGVRLRDGRSIESDAVISTVPPRALCAILPYAVRAEPCFRSLDQIGTAPIVSTHLCFDRPILNTDFVGLVGRKTQWIFNRDRIFGTSSAGQNGRTESASVHALSTVISAAHEIIDWSVEKIRDQTIADLAEVAPVVRSATLVRSVVVKEKHATISVTPATEKSRPEATTPVRNLYLAGDWTRTGLPATIESAVYSGQRAADLVMRHPSIYPS